MKKYHIGLDFGTYQSKACVYNLENESHEFFLFPNGKFFLQSRVGKKADGKFEYGEVTSNNVIENYYYFKIASAEDEEFHTQTYNRSNPGANFYKFNEFENYTPEFLSVIYITYILFTVKNSYRNSSLENIKTGSFLSKFLSKEQDVADNVQFTIQIGIPTEWSQVRNILRKRKFENILLLSEILQKKYETLDKFINLQASQLLSDVEETYKMYNFSDIEAFNSRLNELGISVYPETAAGLTFIVKTRQLNPGYYAIMDIGGGTSDISFFYMKEGGEIKYLASESYMMAANNVYMKYIGGTNSIIELQRAEDEVKDLIARDDWSNNDKLMCALKDVNEQLCKVVYKLFNKRVYWFKTSMTTNFSDQPIIIYGGGIKLPKIRNGKILIHDNGSSQSLNIPLTYLEKKEIGEFTSIINIKPEKSRWEADFPMLAVALGLSFLKPSSSAVWLKEEDYRANDGGLPIEIPHPMNEGYYIYDVLKARWE